MSNIDFTGPGLRKTTDKILLNKLEITEIKERKEVKTILDTIVIFSEANFKFPSMGYIVYQNL